MEDSSFRWVRVKGKVIYDPERKPVSLIGIVQNINAHKLFAAQLNKEVEERTLELQRSNDDLLQFAHVTSHDLKEPLRKIRLYSDRLLDELGDTLRGKGVQYIGKIANATSRMYSMIEGVLKYSSLSSSDQTISLIDLNEVIASILQDQEVLIAEKRASIVFEDLPTIEGASVLIYQLFYNLVNNALKFCRTDITSVITLVATIEKVWGRPFARIVVTDNGIGFHQANAEKMFDMFARLNSRDMFEGTGLGLSLCKKIVERHDGTITATGNKDEGASFTVSLPLQQFKETL
jgi:light-regulated signal transduction histidine kinase (bacteriophytochrome)